MKSIVRAEGSLNRSKILNNFILLALKKYGLRSALPYVDSVSLAGLSWSTRSFSFSVWSSLLVDRTVQSGLLMLQLQGGGSVVPV